MSINTNKPTWPTSVDVVVVGAGFAGLSTASELQKAGLKCIVLEAYDRVGGKSFTKPLQSGRGLVEMGCTWMNSTTQKRMVALVKKYGIEIKEQYIAGSEIFQDEDGKLHKAAVGEVPSTINPKEIEAYEKLVQLITQECDKLNPYTPGVPLSGAAPLAYEDTTFQQWLDDRGATGFAYFMMTFICTGVNGVHPRDCGLYFFLEMIKSCGGWDNMISDCGPNGGQHFKVKTGTTSICQAIAHNLKQESVFLNSVVQRINQTNSICTVTTQDGHSVNCSKVVVTVPSNQYEKITFQPPLPEVKTRYISQCHDNVYNKMIVTYRQPWWRKLGLVGKFSSQNGPINFSWDICDPNTNQYSLALFAVGESGAEWSKLNSIQRQRVLLEHLTQFVGQENKDVVFDILEYNEQEWGKASFIGGACYPALGAGSYNELLPLMKLPFNDIHFAGTETAGNWRGYMEGAVESGERVSKEVLSALHQRGGTILAKL